MKYYNKNNSNLCISKFCINDIYYTIKYKEYQNKRNELIYGFYLQKKEKI